MISLVLVLALGACAGKAVPEVPAPSGAATYTGSGELQTAAQLAFADLHSRLRQHYDPPWDLQRYAEPAGAAWAGVVEHYARALGGDWKPDGRYAEDAGPGYRSKVWTDGERAVAVGALTRGDEQVLLVLVPAKGT